MMKIKSPGIILIKDIWIFCTSFQESIIIKLIKPKEIAKSHVYWL